MPLDPSDDAKLDHSSGTRWPICKQVYPLDSTAIYPKPGHKLLYTPMTGEMKCPRLYLCLAYFIPSPPMSMQHMHQHDQQWYDPLHIITWSYWFIDLDFTCSSPLPSSIGAKSCSSLTATRSIAPKPPTCPSLLQLVHQAKSCLDFLHLDHMTQCHISCAMSSFIITYVSFATSPSHFYLHSICCSHTCTCGLITCVSHINTISPPRLSLNYQNHTRTFQTSF